MLLDAIINGDGARKPLGILNRACRMAQAKETSHTADTIVHENILNMLSRFLQQNPKACCWIANRDTAPQL